MKAAWWWIGGGVAAVALLALGGKPAKPEKPASGAVKKPVITVTETAKKFVRDRLGKALDLQKKYGIPYLFSLAQWGLESAWGKKAPGYNFFGIKATGWNGRKQLLWTTEYVPRNGKKEKIRVQREFRAYDSWEQAVEDWAALIRKPRYQKAFNHKGDPRAFAREIAAAGYATAPGYADALAALIGKIEAEIKNEVKKT